MTDELSFVTPWDRKIYGYLRVSKELKEFFEKEEIVAEDISCIYFLDWGESYNCLISIENDESERTLRVKRDAVFNLLENCFRIPSQCEK